MVWLWVLALVVLAFGWVVVRGAPYVPSQQRYIKRALTSLYPLGDHDTLVDVGSGDGVVLRSASRLGAYAVGYEINPILVAVSRLLSRGDANVHVQLADFWTMPLPDATTIVYAFIVTRDVQKMITKMQTEASRLEHPIAFITYGNMLPDLAPDKSLDAYHLYTFYPLHHGVA